MKLSIKPLIKPLVIIIAISIAMIVVFASFIEIYDTWYFNSLEKEGLYTESNNCNIAVIPIVDEITSLDAGTWEDIDWEDINMTSADRVIAKIRDAETDRSIRGLILQIDSGGGGPVASEMIMNELIRFSKPSVGLIREYGASGAYLAATGADTIIASAFSDVGGIGVNASYLESSQANTEAGIEYVQLTSAIYKDYGSPDRPITNNERWLIDRDLATFHRFFINLVSQNRKLSVADVEKLADGSTLPGAMALEAGLIDQIGDELTAKEWFSKQLHLPVKSVIACN